MGRCVFRKYSYRGRESYGGKGKDCNRYRRGQTRSVHEFSVVMILIQHIQNDVVFVNVMSIR